MGDNKWKRGIGDIGEKPVKKEKAGHLTTSCRITVQMWRQY
jgi:hypothetical protein